MIKEVYIERYRKLKNINFTFSDTLNIISGTNGTCKTSLLHIISNSFQAANTNDINMETPKSNDCLKCIKNINNFVNPKIETLTKGDSQYNDPAPGYTGNLYQIKYINGKILSFRRHNSTKYKGEHRYAVKPRYKKGTQESLPHLPVIYLGLTRLFPYGEYHNEDLIEKVSLNLPEEYQQIVSELFYDFTGIQIRKQEPQKMGDVKTRGKFETLLPGVDSNTISSGEDNLFIILTALLSLKYYFDNTASTQDILSILLIDELDASLHPAFQLKLLNLFNKYSKKYKIQIFFTTHSLTLIEQALKSSANVLYLLDNIDSVFLMEDVDIYKINMHLTQKSNHDLYLGKKIPVFTEDNEARIVIGHIFDYFSENAPFKDSFNRVRHRLHFVEANISSETLDNIFSDSNLLRSTMRSICILDGDKKRDLAKHTTTLPGKSSPEDFIMGYGIYLDDNNSDFWKNPSLINAGFGRPQFKALKKDFEEIDIRLKKEKSDGNSTHGKRRSETKKFFKKNDLFLSLILKEWLNSEDSNDELNLFYNDLRSLYKKVAEFHGLSAKDWV